METLLQLKDDKYFYLLWKKKIDVICMKSVMAGRVTMSPGWVFFFVI